MDCDIDEIESTLSHGDYRSRYPMPTEMDDEFLPTKLPIVYSDQRDWRCDVCYHLNKRKEWRCQDCGLRCPCEFKYKPKEEEEVESEKEKEDREKDEKASEKNESELRDKEDDDVSSDDGAPEVSDRAIKDSDSLQSAEKSSEDKPEEAPSGDADASSPMTKRAKALTPEESQSSVRVNPAVNTQNVATKPPVVKVAPPERQSPENQNLMTKSPRGRVGPLPKTGLDNQNVTNKQSAGRGADPPKQPTGYSYQKTTSIDGMKPGQWSCSRCTTFNDAVNTACSVCQSQRTKSDDFVERQSNPIQPRSGPGSAGYEKSKGATGVSRPQGRTYESRFGKRFP